MFIRGVGGPEPIKPNNTVSKGGKVNINQNNQVSRDEVSISEDAKQILQRKQAEDVALATIRNTPDIRQSAVERGKRFIESGEYKSEKAIENVSKKISDEIIASAMIRKEDGKI
ncbi:MAG: flagellar biosynthesis anti-sigma factor FlgM [Spirochaetia bacterium]|nr:flagellar biosynthesis anti-sigma factor FlgM [Spirochaetota bacterium]MCX8096602.1 flagellar biosynthesis anti-sigma factor FlgM [Spirochaetota bacterium]MDW8112049.1 flagellar biosynthesis anti-sigma factor FlgM [Spirochaetia bacterium]